MSDEDEPRWELLPLDPVGFFDLPSEFDRKQLKRKYNALIRRFKPERFPDEFQKIRAAYEELDGRLRYGQDISTGPIVPTNWRPNSPRSNRERHEARDDSGQPRQEPTRAKTLIDRLDDEPVEQLYAELQSRDYNTPYDFYCLAVLSDLVEQKTKDSFHFLQWLLNGLRVYPNDPALFRLVYTYLGERISDDNLASVLLTVSNVVSSDRFYYLTERIWERLLGASEFATFQRTLQRCENNLRDYRIDAKLTFYVRILRRALFKAPQHWLDAVASFIDQNSGHLTEDSEYELECTQRIQEYLFIRESFNNGHPVRELIDRTIVDYATLNLEQADHSVVACQNYIAAHSNEVLDAFPLRDQEIVGKAMPAWFWVTEEVRQRLDLYAAPKIDPDYVLKDVRRMMVEFDEIEDTMGWELISWIENGAHLVMGGLMFFWSFPVCWLFLSGANFYTVASLIGIVSLLLYGKYLHASLIGSLILRMKQAKIERAYNELGRMELARFFDSTHYPYRLIANIMEALLERPLHATGQSISMCLYLPQDLGMWIYSNAQSYLK